MKDFVRTILDYPVKGVEFRDITTLLQNSKHFQKVIDEIICVSDDDMINAMKFAYENFKFILEPACVAGIAALLGPLKNKLKNQNTLIILCGSNIDMKTWIKLTK